MTDREKLIELMFSYQDEHNSIVVDKGILADHLIANGVTVRHGRWMDNEDYMFCSCCGMQWNYCDNDTEDFHYCPNCGCRMDGDDDK